MLPPSFTYFLDMSAFLKKYPHIGLKLGEDGKHLLQTYIEGKIHMEIRKHHEHLKTLNANKKRLEAELLEMKMCLANAQEKQLAAEALWSTSSGQIDQLNARINKLEDINRDSKREICHMKHFCEIQNDLETFIEEEYREFVPMVAASVTSSDLDSSRSVRSVTENEQMKFHLLQSQVSLNMVKVDIIQSSIQNLTREEKRVQEVADSIAEAREGEIDAELAKEVDMLLVEIKETRIQLEAQLEDSEHNLAINEHHLAEKEKELDTTAEITVLTNTDLVSKLRTTIENMRRGHARKLREQRLRHGKEIDEMIERMQKINQKHMEDVEKLKVTIRKKMFEVHKREMLHKKLRGQIRVMENYQSRNMNSTVSLQQCRKIVRAIIGEARILRDIADERETVVQQAEADAARKMEESNNRSKGSKTDKGKITKVGKIKKKKIPECLNEERLRYISEKISNQWRKLGAHVGLTENHLDIIEMDAGSASAERAAYYMLRVWRDEEGGRPAKIALSLLEMGYQQLAMLLVPLSKLIAMKQAMLADAESDSEEPEMASPHLPVTPSAVPALPVIAAQ